MIDLTTDELYKVNDAMRALLADLHLLPADNDEQDALLDVIVMEFADVLDNAGVERTKEMAI